MTHTIYVQRFLDAGRQRIYVDLETPQWIDQLVVTMSRYPAGSYSGSHPGQEVFMSLTAIIVLALVFVLVLGGGGYCWHARSR